MDVRVHGKRMQVGDRLRELAEEKLGNAGRIFGERALVDVEFIEQHNPRIGDERFRVEITTLVAQRTVRVEAAAPDARAALDMAHDKFERRLRDLKERLIQRSRTDDHKRLNAPEIPAEDEEVDDREIVRVKQFAMKPMMPEEAALQMEMLGHSFYFFVNGESDSYSVLYRRRDGSLGLIEPA